MNCAVCSAGLQKGFTNHVVNLDKQIIIIKSVPANICRQCGESFIDHQTAKNLERILEEPKKSGAEITIINYFDKVA